jgi:hypothetical protein
MTRPTVSPIPAFALAAGKRGIGLFSSPLLILGVMSALFAGPSIGGGCLAPYWEQTVLTDRAAISVVAADLDGDGKPDIAGITATGAFVLRNDGTGKFANAVDVYSATLGGSIVAGDFNGDRRIDLAFARDGAIIVLPGKGDGTFGAAIESPISIKPAALAAGRFDSDAAIDLVAFDPDAAKLVVFRNNGAGTFTELQTSALHPDAAAIVAVDLDNDGKMDVIVGYGTRSALDAFYGRGNGTFDVPVAILGITSNGLAAADMDSNGLPDLAVADPYGRVAVIRNLGSRSFGDPLLYLVARSTRVNALHAADLTGDGKVDLVMSAACGIRTSTGSGTGTLALQFLADDPECYDDFEFFHGGMAIADFDGDGRTDVAAAFPRLSGKPGVTGFRNLCGDGIVTAATESPVISLGQSVRITTGVLPPGKQEYWFIPAGNLSLREGQTERASASLKGNTTFTVPDLTLGDHTFVVDYSGDQQYEPRQSAPLTVRVTTATTTAKLTADPPVGVYGHTPLLTATVTSSTGDTPNGPIRFTVDGNTYASQNGKAPRATASGVASVGEHLFIAEFVGDATHPPSKSTLAYTVSKQTPTIEAIPPFAIAGQAVPFSLAVHNTGDASWPKGTLTLRIGEKIIGTQTTDNYPYQQFFLPALEAGRPELHVTYGGDPNYASVDMNVPFVVLAASPPSIDARGTSDGVLATWHGPNHIYLSRRKPGQPWSGAVCCTDPPWLDKFPEPETVYLFRSESYDHSSISNVDSAMRFPFTDDPLPPAKSVSAAQLAEVVRATNILRAAAGLGPVSLPPVPMTSIRRRIVGAGIGVPSSEVKLLRDAINEAREALGAYRFVFTAPLAANTTINAVQIQELREAVR